VEGAGGGLVGQLRLGLVALPDGGCQLDLLAGGQQRHLADLLEVHPGGVADHPAFGGVAGRVAAAGRTLPRPQQPQDVLLVGIVVEVDDGLVELDALGVECPADLTDQLCGELGVLEDLDDLVEGEAAP
jgi:hypothetical protein